MEYLIEVRQVNSCWGGAALARLTSTIWHRLKKLSSKQVRATCLDKFMPNCTHLFSLCVLFLCDFLSPSLKQREKKNRKIVKK